MYPLNVSGDYDGVLDVYGERARKIGNGDLAAVSLSEPTTSIVQYSILLNKYI